MTPQDAFSNGLAFVLSAEGGFVHDPADHGGATNAGITQRTYEKWLMEKCLPLADVHQISAQEVRQIYRDYYWDELKLDDVVEHCSPDLAIALFDTGVNTGPGRAVKILQKIVCPETMDGVLGPGTMGAARKAEVIEGKDVVGLLLDERISYYQRLADQNKAEVKFLQGWLNRVEHLKTYLEELV